MNAAVSTEPTEFLSQMTKNSFTNGTVLGITNTIRKADVLRYYRETKQAFLNLGGLLISQTDGQVYFFNNEGELVGFDRIQI